MTQQQQQQQETATIMQDLALDDAGSSWIDTFSALDSKVRRVVSCYLVVLHQRYPFSCSLLFHSSYLLIFTPTLQAFLNTFLQNKVRSDGRLFSACRPTTITSGVVTRNAAGSALVCIGSTQVLGAISLQVGTPAAGYSQQGDLVVVTSSQYNTWLERVLLESGMVDLTSLSILTAKAAWRIQVVLTILNDNGNVRDAMLLAAVAALRDAVLPRTSIDKNGVVSLVVHESINESDINKQERLCVDSMNIPIPLSVGFITNNTNNKTIILVDPTTLEQELCESTCCLVLNASNPRNVINCELSGSVGLSSQQLALVAQMAQGRAQEVAKLME